MDLPVYNTLILSDLHLGAETSHAREATRVLKETRFQRLILLGDIFADLNFARLTKDHWKFLGFIRKLSNPKRGIEVVWVEGNHDHGLANIMSHLVGVRVYESYEWNYRGRQHVAIHGHQFDGFQVNRMTLSRVGTTLYLQLQKLDFKNKPIARMIDRLNTRWMRMSTKVASGALNYARNHSADRIFCGHTHEAIHVERDGIDYYNSGGWVDSRLTYLTIDEQGVQIHEYDKRADDRDSGEERGEADSAFADLSDESGLLEDVAYAGAGR
jgi:UDP-2,3-diacylglucosamine pyrophosphatase LpxH